MAIWRGITVVIADTVSETILVKRDRSDDTLLHSSLNAQHFTFFVVVALPSVVDKISPEADPPMQSSRELHTKNFQS